MFMKLILFFSSVFLSSISFAAEWGDTFFCEMTHFHSITADGEFKDYEPEKFRFQLNEEKNAMVFGQTGFFLGLEITLQPEQTILSVDYWVFYQNFLTGMYDKGLLVLATTHTSGIESIRATCDNFK